MGLNAIFLFVASGIVARILLKTHIGSGESDPSTYTWIYENWFLPWAGLLEWFSGVCCDCGVILVVDFVWNVSPWLGDKNLSIQGLLMGSGNRLFYRICAL